MGKRTKYKCFTPNGHPIVIYKKGKKHRVFIDTVTNEVIMTNPSVLGRAAKFAAKQVPFLGTAIDVAEMASEFIPKKAGQATRKSEPMAQYSSKGRLSVFEKALMAKALDR